MKITFVKALAVGRASQRQILRLLAHITQNAPLEQQLHESRGPGFI